MADSLIRRASWKLGSDQFAVPYLSFWARLLRRIRKPLIIGVTGSVGKTTTTELLAAVLT